MFTAGFADARASMQVAEPRRCAERPNAWAAASVPCTAALSALGRLCAETPIAAGAAPKGAMLWGTPSWLASNPGAAPGPDLLLAGLRSGVRPVALPACAAGFGGGVKPVRLATVRGGVLFRPSVANEPRMDTLRNHR